MLQFKNPFHVCNYFISFFFLSFACKLPLIQDRRPLCYVTIAKGVTIRVNTQLKISEHSVESQNDCSGSSWL